MSAKKQSKRSKASPSARAKQSLDVLDADEAEKAFVPTYDDLLPMDGIDDEVPQGCERGYVVRLDRGFPLIVTRSGSYRSQHAIALVKHQDTRASVGDAVVLQLPNGHDKAIIQRILPRRTELTRWDGHSRGARQRLAANIDLIIAVQPASKRQVSVDRIARSAVLAHEGGMRFAVVLTKCDRAPEDTLKADEDGLRTVLGKDTICLRTSMLTGEGLEAVRTLIPSGVKALLLGESGAGKSTLVNSLLGANILGTGEVRTHDDAGRHTTVARRMLKIPGGGVIADAPGLRSLPLLDEERGLAGTFPDIDELVASCRFRDCTHGNEPGCAVRLAVDEGRIPSERLEEYRALKSEMHANRLSLDLSAPQSLTR